VPDLVGQDALEARGVIRAHDDAAALVERDGLVAVGGADLDRRALEDRVLLDQAGDDGLCFGFLATRDLQDLVVGGVRGGQRGVGETVVVGIGDLLGALLRGCIRSVGRCGAGDLDDLRGARAQARAVVAGDGGRSGDREDEADDRDARGDCGDPDDVLDLQRAPLGTSRFARRPDSSRVVLRWVETGRFVSDGLVPAVRLSWEACGLR
jgi:hypothetical protein